MTPIEQASINKVLNDLAAFSYTHRDFTAIASDATELIQKFTTLTEPLEDEIARLQKSLEGADELNLANQQLADANKMLREALSEIDSTASKLGVRYVDLIPYCRKAKQALTKPT